MNGSLIKADIEARIQYENAPSYPILVTSSYGKISPNETLECKETDTISLMFNADSNYQFIRWRVVDRKTNKEIENQDNIEFDDIYDNNTKFTLNKGLAGLNVLIEPYCEIRPKVVSATPLYDTNGVYRDRPIVIMFNKEMSEKSIYWTEEELKSMNVPLENAFEATGITYYENGINKKYYHAYWDGSNPNSYVFKNISITKYTNDSINYLQHYGIPKFDDSNTRVLRIPSKIETVDNKIVSKAPPSATDILVTLNKNLFYEINNNKINLSEEYSWTYATNLDTDVAPPEFDTTTFEVHFADIEQDTYRSEKEKIDKSILDKVNNTPVTNIPKFNAKNKSFWVKGKFTDKGSGPGNLQWYITKVNSTYYPASRNILVAQGRVLELSIVGQNATIGTGANANTETGGVLIDVSENLANGYKDLPEGTYALYFEAFDKNGQGTKSDPFYFVYDVTPPAASTVSYASTIAKDVVEVRKYANSTSDYYKTDIAGVEFNTAATKKLRNLGADSRHHTITIKDYDFAGNCNTTTKDITAVPEVGYIFYDDCYWSSIEDLDNAVITGRKPVGIIIENIDTKASSSFTDKVKIIAIERDAEARYVITDNWSSDYPHGWNGKGGSDRMDLDGLTNYIKIINTSGALDHSEVHKYLYEVKNNYNENKIIWYLPALNEYLGFNGYFNRDRRYEFDSQLRILKSKGYTELSTYAKISGDDTSIQEIISSTIFNDGGHWAGITTYWYGSDFYLDFRKDRHQTLKTRSLYMAQVTLD